jgi:DNA repair exonuclease SbcCD ATPase subunit
MSSNSNLFFIAKWILFPLMIFIIFYGIYITFEINESNHMQQIEKILQRELMKTNEQSKELRIIINELQGKNKSLIEANELKTKLIKVEELIGIEYQKKKEEIEELKEKIKKLEKENEKLKSNDRKSTNDQEKWNEIDSINKISELSDLLKQEKNGIERYQLENQQNFEEIKKLIGKNEKKCNSFCNVKMLAFNLYEGKQKIQSFF